MTHKTKCRKLSQTLRTYFKVSMYYAFIDLQFFNCIYTVPYSSGFYRRDSPRAYVLSITKGAARTKGRQSARSLAHLIPVTTDGVFLLTPPKPRLFPMCSLREPRTSPGLCEWARNRSIVSWIVELCVCCRRKSTNRRRLQNLIWRACVVTSDIWEAEIDTRGEWERGRLFVCHV